MTPSDWLSAATLALSAFALWRLGRVARMGRGTCKALARVEVKLDQALRPEEFARPTPVSASPSSSS